MTTERCDSMECPKCKSSLLDILNCDYIDDEQGYCWKEISSYKCLNCGCYFDVIIETTIKFKINE